jgi:hypothetical protein
MRCDAESQVPVGAGTRDAIICKQENISILICMTAYPLTAKLQGPGSDQELLRSAGFGRIRVRASGGCGDRELR